MSETPLHFKTITELADLIRSKSISPVEVAEAQLNRIRDQDSTYKSYATVMSEQAMASARAAEQAIAAGAVKDLAEARQIVRNSFDTKIFEPKPSEAIEAARARFDQL